MQRGVELRGAGFSNLTHENRVDLHCANASQPLRCSVISASESVVRCDTQPIADYAALLDTAGMADDGITTVSRMRTAADAVDTRACSSAADAVEIAACAGAVAGGACYTTRGCEVYGCIEWGVWGAGSWGSVRGCSRGALAVV